MNIKFDKITVSPIAAVVEGEIKGGENFDRDPARVNNAEHPVMNFNLIVNGETYYCDSRSMSNTNNLMEFKNESITIPPEITTLKIANINLPLKE